MPILDVAIPLPVDELKRVRILSCCLDTCVEEWYKKHAGYQIPAILTLMTALTCFAVVPFRGGLRYRDWTMFYATIGLLVSLSICSIMWAMVYAQEQLPKGDADWIRRVVAPGVGQHRSPLERKDYFAFTGSDYSYAIFDLKAVTGWTRTAVHGASLSGALSAIIGYVCQYVEVRQTTAKQAILWLSIQAILAILRVTVWIWNPTFDDFTMRKEWTMTHIQMSEAQLVMLWYSHINPKRSEPSMQSRTLPGTKVLPRTLHVHDLIRKHQACPPGWYYQTIPDALTIPNWVVHALHVAETEVHLLFSTAKTLKSEGSNWQKTFDRVAKAERYWDMPQWLFMLWVDAHEDETLLAQNLRGKVPKLNSYSCRIIQDADGNFSFIPYWTVDCSRLERNGNDSSLLDDPYLDGQTSLGICIFGDPNRDDYSIFSFCHAHKDQEDAAMTDQHLTIGFRAFKYHEKQKLTGLQDKVVQYHKEMWETLEAIIERARILNAARQKHEDKQALRTDEPVLSPQHRVSSDGYEPGIDGDLIGSHRIVKRPSPLPNMSGTPLRLLSQSRRVPWGYEPTVEESGEGSKGAREVEERVSCEQEQPINS
ncbi:MAG: hypothetical protein L6R42_007036 [Xanthoria sp. 1 TBL-2021]|nr:MAG: hypothetical protein L6R42_007036 [Xanthoria sp. 1 TBL-2021]